MAPKTIVVGGVRAVLSSDEGYSLLLEQKNAQCLLSSDNVEIYDFGSLVEGGVYSLGPPEQLNWSNRPPLYPGSATGAKNREDMLSQKLDQILQATATKDRATPPYSAAFIGSQEKKRLENAGRFTAFEGRHGCEAVLSEEQVKQLSAMENEHQVVAFLTPVFEGVVRDTVSWAVFNSEEYKWIETSSETSVYNEKPDLIICHPALISSKPPFKCEADEKLKEMRRGTEKYGVLSKWKLRDFIGATCKAKQHIDNKAFGGVINYGAHICFGKHGPVMARLILFDKKMFWLVESVKGAVSHVVTCSWADRGSKNLLRDFVHQPALPKLLDEVCHYFNLTVAMDSFLGAGAFGLVFRARRAGGNLIAIKITLGSNNVQRLQVEKEKMTRAKSMCPDEVMGLEEPGFMTFEGGAALLLSAVGEHFSNLSPQSIVDSLKMLHNSGITHGDARLENVVCVDGKPCWIDFAESQRPLLKAEEMEGLLACLEQRFGYVAMT